MKTATTALLRAVGQESAASPTPHTAGSRLPLTEDPMCYLVRWWPSRALRTYQNTGLYLRPRSVIRGGMFRQQDHILLLPKDSSSSCVKVFHVVLRPAYGTFRRTSRSYTRAHRFIFCGTQCSAPNRHPSSLCALVRKKPQIIVRDSIAQAHGLGS